MRDHDEIFLEFGIPKRLPSDQVAIYCLFDGSGHAKYVGKSIWPRRRYIEHIKNKWCGNIKKYEWMKTMIANNETPEMEILSIVGMDGWEKEERFWIAYFQFLGCNLVNLDSGGISGKQRHLITKQLLSSSLKAECNPDKRAKMLANIEKMAKLRRGMKQSEAWKAKRMQKWGFHLSKEEFSRLQSIRAKKAWSNKVTLAKLRPWEKENIGRRAWEIRRRKSSQKCEV